MIGELQLVFTVKNKYTRGELGVTHIFKYIGAKVKLL